MYAFAALQTQALDTAWNARFGAQLLDSLGSAAHVWIPDS
jgi:hypothetical protein